MAALTKCVRCNASITPSDKFCPECGSKIDWGAGGTGDLLNFFSQKPEPKKKKTKTDYQCEFCGVKNKKGATFCESCGSILPAAHGPEEEDIGESFELLFNKPQGQQTPEADTTEVDETPVPKKRTQEKKPVPEEITGSEKEEKLIPPPPPIQVAPTRVPSPHPQERERKEELPPKKPVERDEPIRKKPQRLQRKKIEPWKIYIAIAAVLIVFILLYALLRDSNVAVPQGNTISPTGPTLEQLQQLEADVKANPKNAEAVLTYANALHDAKSYKRAIDYYQRYLALSPKDPDAYVDLGICYFESNDAEKAIATMKQALLVSPRHQKAYFNIGIVSLNTGDKEQADENFRKAIEIDPASATGIRAKELLESHGK